ncbi:hypothetical protein PMAYCL1PPCAC_17705 [Pristionchus mayeri]|uniref:C2H2-type domain-containing protein n=1 Tax=Pristionchus mayeri TaxID=1317129 RepID=A0AAN5CN60_9BILA|nr:hypothetical protein PMAYCL1PPCAC_17705 [Pristionchus mayeri]
MSKCNICDVRLEHRLELVEHQSSLSHQIRVGATLEKGGKRICPVCKFSCSELAEYSKHVDSDSHLVKLRALRNKRIAMVDSCFPSKKNSRWDSRSPAYYPSNMPPPSFGYPPPPSMMPPNHFNSFFRPPMHSDRPRQWTNEQRGGQPSTSTERTEGTPNNTPPHPPKSGRKSMYKKEKRKGMHPAGEGVSPGKKKKKKGGVISKVLSAADIVKNKKKEIVTTPKVTSMENKSKRYESLARKGAGIVASNKSRTQVMMMERQIKYSLVDGQGASIEDTRGNGSFSSIPSITAPLHSPPPVYHPPPISSPLNGSFNPSTASDATYAFCHPVHSTPHQLHDSNWPEFVRGMDALHEEIPSTSNLGPSQQGQSASYMNGGGLNMRRVKEEVREEEEEEIKVEPPSEQSISLDSLSINQKIKEKETKWKKEYEEQQRKLSALAARREETRRRFEEEMKSIDEEEKRERAKMTMLESTRASFHSDLRKVLQSHGF